MLATTGFALLGNFLRRLASALLFLHFKPVGTNTTILHFLATCIPFSFMFFISRVAIEECVKVVTVTPETSASAPTLLILVLYCCCCSCCFQFEVFHFPFLQPALEGSLTLPLHHLRLGTPLV